MQHKFQLTLYSFVLLAEEVGISDFAISHFTYLKKEIHEISFPNLMPSMILISMPIRKD